MKKSVIGLETVMRNLRKEVTAIEGRSLKGLILAAILVRRSMEQDSPKVPVRYSNLRHSFFITTSRGETTAGAAPSFSGKNASQLASDHASVLGQAKALAKKGGYPFVVLGFGANYALWVHEKVGEFIRWNRPGSGPKFLERAVLDNKEKILEVVKKNATIKK